MDTAWGIGIALAALTAFLTSVNQGQNERRYLLLAASFLWGLRLAAYLGWRNHGKPEDPRYQDMLDKAKEGLPPRLRRLPRPHQRLHPAAA